MPARRCWGDTLPPNFSWLEVNVLAGSGCPQSELELLSLAGIGIHNIVTLSPETLPPICISAMPQLGWTKLPIENFKGAKLQEFAEFFDLCEKKPKGAGLLVHCRSGRGRTGMFLAAFLIKFRGMAAKEAIDKIRSLRPNSVETRDQEESLLLLEKSLNEESS